MICNVMVDTSDTYIENNVAYFYINVTNYENDIITATDVDYTLTISNKDGSNGLFYYIDDEGNTSSETEEYVDTITTSTLSFGQTKTNKKFKVYVKVESGYKETVNFNVNLDAVQKK